MAGLNLEAIRARADAATPGPWANDDLGLYSLASVLPGIEPITVDLTVGKADDDHWSMRVREGADAEFIAHARSDVPALCDEVERLRKELARYRYERERCTNGRHRCDGHDG